jgi:hypothetical protein
LAVFISWWSAGCVHGSRGGPSAWSIPRFSLGKAGAAKQDGLSKGEIMTANLAQQIGVSTDETDRAQIMRLRKALQRIADLPQDQTLLPLKKTPQYIAIAALRHRRQKEAKT